MAKDQDGSAANLGLYPAAGLLVGVSVGYWLGQKFGWGIWGLCGGAALGLTTGLYLLIKEGMRINK